MADALADLDRIHAFNSQHVATKADRVERRIHQRLAALLLTPHIGRPITKPGVRVLSLPDIQYVIYYHVEDEAIRVLRIYSTAEDRP